ncbi:MAG: Asp23/Gls24 family envelope stress response protein [Gaiellaceae bacterium]
MSDNYVIQASGGTITVAPAVLSQIVLRSAESVEGARVRRPRRGLDVEVQDGSARVTLELAVRFGRVLPDVARDVQERIAEALRSTCGLETSAVEVAVEELDT